MFTLIESREEIAKLQQKLESTIRRDFKKRVVKNIGYPGGTEHNASVYTDGSYWYWSSGRRSSKDKIPRFLNWFGLFDSVNDLQISVEINTPFIGRTRQVAGYFARDSDTGSIYLFHSGRVAGGTKGVGKNAFLAWSQQTPVEIADSVGGVRDGILVMPIAGIAASRSAIRYVNTVANFKRAVRAGELNSRSFQRKEKDLNDFRSESSGRRTGRRSPEIDYLSRHGEVVDALYSWRTSSKMPDRSRIVKNVLIDLGVESRGELVEVFEVKTSSSRSDIYRAIGQLMVHGTAIKCRRVIVLPGTEQIATDQRRALQRLRIEIINFDLDEINATIRG